MDTQSNTSLFFLKYSSKYKQLISSSAIQLYEMKETYLRM